MAVLGQLYELGEGTTSDIKLALKWNGEAILSGKLNETNLEICRNRINRYVQEGLITEEEAAPYLQ